MSLFVGTVFTHTSSNARQLGGHVPSPLSKRGTKDTHVWTAVPKSHMTPWKLLFQSKVFLDSLL